MAFAPQNTDLKHCLNYYFVALKEQLELKALMDEHYIDLELKSLQVAEKTAKLDIAIHQLNRFIRQQNLNDSFYHFLDAFRLLASSRSS